MDGHAVERFVWHGVEGLNRGWVTPLTGGARRVTVHRARHGSNLEKARAGIESGPQLTPRSPSDLRQSFRFIIR